jgi:general secretion pathway protein A
MILNAGRTAVPEHAMYESFYGFSGSPFKLTPDARFFYGSRAHTRAIAHLTFGLSQGEGFVVITGEVGAGKTTLVERLWSQLNRDTHTLARVSTTQLSGDDLLRLAMAGFGVESRAAAKAPMLLAFSEVLRVHHQTGRRCLLVVDEAQNLPMAALEELRMLSNLTDDGHASLQTILLGQPQFRRMLASPDLDQLRQRVLASFHLTALEATETRAYVEHRLSTVGWSGSPEIEAAAYSALHRHSGGIPRRINRLCARVLLHGALEHATMLTAEMVENIAEELQEDLEGGAPPPTGLDTIGDAGANHGSLSHPSSVPPDDLLERLEMLELRVQQREHILQRLKDVLVRRL